MQDLVDIARMLAVADKQTLDAVRSAVQTHHPAASDDIERMIVLVKSENQ